MLNVKINLDEIMDFIAEGQGCKVQIFEDGHGEVYPASAQGYDGAVHKINLEAYDFEEFEGDVEAYRSWLSDGANAVKTDIEIEMDFI